MSETELKYQENVAAILRNARGEILICERVSVNGAWQFPQGGVDEGETLEQAMVREVWEEVGVKARDFTVAGLRGPYRYVFGDGRTKRGFHGKVQHYFLCDFTGADTAVNVETEHPEFRAFRWVRPEDFEVEWLPEMKREVYAAVFADFFGVEMRASA